MDACELEAADNANAEGLWLDLVRIFERPQVSEVVSLLRAVESQLSYPSPVLAPVAAPKRSLFRRLFSRKA